MRIWRKCPACLACRHPWTSCPQGHPRVLGTSVDKLTRACGLLGRCWRALSSRSRLNWLSRRFFAHWQGGPCVTGPSFEVRQSAAGGWKSVIPLRNWKTTELWRWITTDCRGCAENEHFGTGSASPGLQRYPHSLSTACCTDSVCSRLTILLNLLEKHPEACSPRLLWRLAIHGQFIHKVIHEYWVQGGNNLSRAVSYLVGAGGLGRLSRMNWLSRGFFAQW